MTIKTGKVMAFVTCDVEGISLVDYLENERTINAHILLTFWKLEPKIKDKNPSLATIKVLFHEENPPSYKASPTFMNWRFKTCRMHLIQQTWLLRTSAFSQTPRNSLWGKSKYRKSIWQTWTKMITKKGSKHWRLRRGSFIKGYFLKL